MPSIPSRPNVPSGGSRQQKAEALRAQMETKTAAPAQKTGAQFHHVQEGETLESIASQYGQSPDTIWQHPLNKQLRNRLGTPEGLARGDGIYIPEVEEEEGGGPVGQGDYEVKVGDCMASIAIDTGHFWETIWNDPDNSELKDTRKDPYVLLPGDLVTIPPIRPKEEPGETEKRHRFVRNGAPEKLIVKFMIEDEPRANEDYVLDIDGVEQEGTTDAQGKIDVFIPPDAKRATITFTESGDTYQLDLGRLDPITELTGVQKRLKNLGFFKGKPDGKMSPELEKAISKFQKEYEMEVTGELDETTREKIREVHDG